MSVIDAKEVEVHSAIGSNVSVKEAWAGLLVMLASSLGVDNLSSQIASFTAAINLASSSVNSSGTPQISNCSMLIFQTILFIKLIYCNTMLDYNRLLYLLYFWRRRSRFITNRSVYISVCILTACRAICVGQEKIQEKTKFFFGCNV